MGERWEKIKVKGKSKLREWKERASAKVESIESQGGLIPIVARKVSRKLREPVTRERKARWRARARALRAVPLPSMLYGGYSLPYAPRAPACAP